MSAVRRQGAHTLVLGDRDRRNFPLPAVPVAVQDRLQDGRYPVGGFAEPEHGARTTDGIRIQHLCKIKRRIKSIEKQSVDASEASGFE